LTLEFGLRYETSLRSGSPFSPTSFLSIGGTVLPFYSHPQPSEGNRSDAILLRYNDALLRWARIDRVLRKRAPAPGKFSALRSGPPLPPDLMAKKMRRARGHLENPQEAHSGLSAEASRPPNTLQGRCISSRRSPDEARQALLSSPWKSRERT